MPLTKVLFDPVRSAEPPISSGIAANSSSSAAPDDWRVAWAGLVSTSSAIFASSLANAPSGRSPLLARVKSAAGDDAASRASQA